MEETKQGELERIKTNIKGAYEYFKPNYDRYNDFRQFIFESSLTADEITLLSTIGRPQLEFNVLEAYINRLLGEFSQSEPDIEVNAENPDKADPLMIKVIEMHLRHAVSNDVHGDVRYQVYKELLSGGFSVFHVEPEYPTPRSIRPVIKIKASSDPTLCGFDDIAREPHKGDGRFCFELRPMTEDEFKAEHPDIPTNEISYSRDFEGFSWSYMNGKTKIILVADYYEKKKRKAKLVQLSDGSVIEYKDYKKMIKEWREFEMPPAIIGKPVERELEDIVRYRLITNRILEYKETDFDMFPLVFVDGSSVTLKTPKNGSVRQFTRPYVYHARGAQRFKNYAGITWANELENMGQSKWIVAKEALPKEDDLLTAYTDPQKSSVLVFNSVHENNPELPINNPIQPAQRVPMPPEVSAAFTESDSLIQNILGSYDASLGINNNQLSGRAIELGALQSNATAMPYIVGFMNGYTRAAQVYVSLMPKYYTTPQTLPIIDEKGKKGYIKINQKDGLDTEFDPTEFNVSIKAGASFQIQKSKALQMIKDVCSFSPQFGQFMAEKGMSFVLDNMEGRGIEQLKTMIDQWQQEMQAQKQMMMQQQQQEMQNNPAMIKAKMDAQKMQLQAAKDAKQFQLDLAQLQQDQQRLEADLAMSEKENQARLIEAETERYSKAIDLAIAHENMLNKHKIEGINVAMEHKDMKHRHAKEKAEFQHMRSEANKPERRMENG